MSAKTQLKNDNKMDMEYLLDGPMIAELGYFLSGSVPNVELSKTLQKLEKELEKEHVKNQ